MEKVTNKDLLDYMQVIQNSIDKSQKTVNMIDESPKIQVMNQNNDININVNNESGVNKESRDRILNVIQSILKLSEDENTQDTIINLDDIGENKDDD